jgi:hypothetical protein
MTVLKSSCTNKNLKTIVCFVYNIVSYVLSKEDKLNNMLDCMDTEDAYEQNDN